MRALGSRWDSCWKPISEVLGIEAISMDTNTHVAVVGSGISGLVTAKCLLDDKFDIVVYEKTNEIGGLWHFRENDYGVMRFTHINVSKYNYCFSDYPFPDNVPDFPHHSHMLKYIQSYAEHFDILRHIQFNTKVININEEESGLWKVTSVKVDKKGSEIGSIQTNLFKYVAIATGHHAIPKEPSFDGQVSFKGDITHSIHYKDAITNGLVGKRVVVVGIGNSAVDVVVNVAELGGAKPVFISTRSGAWVLPNYVAGYPTDLYACRAFLWLPWQISSWIFGCIVRGVSGSPWKWGLNPKMGSLQTQPTVSPTLIHHIQRMNIIVKPNIAKLESNKVVFTDGSRVEADAIVCCTGYSISLPFLSERIRSFVLEEGTNITNLYKSVFNPEIGSSLAFIGFIQPASGGLLPVSEIQARWFSAICKGLTKLPPKQDMHKDIKHRNLYLKHRYFASSRHTIQQDPIIYNDEVSSYFGAKPQLWQNPTLAWNLFVGSCGAAQWRLQGPHKWNDARKVVKSIPLTPMMQCFGYLVLIIPAVLVSFIICKFWC